MELFSSIIDLLQLIMILVASIIAIYQLRRNTLSNKSESFSRIGDRLQSINEIIYNNTEVYKMLLLTPEEVNEFMKCSEDSEFENKMQILLDMIFAYFREIYYQYNKYKLIDNAQWSGWEETIHRTLNKSYVKWYWEQKQIGYPNEFVDFVNEILKKPYQSLVNSTYRPRMIE